MLGVAAFVFIVLALLCVTAFFAYQHTMNVIGKRLSAQRRQHRRSIKAVVAEHAEMKDRIIALETATSKSPSPFSAPNFKERMENRAIAERNVIIKEPGARAERV